MYTCIKIHTCTHTYVHKCTCTYVHVLRIQYRHPDGLAGGNTERACEL